MTSSALTEPRYSGISVALHWVSALLVTAMLPAGFVMTRLPDGDGRLALYRAHIALGWAVVALTVARVSWRVVRPAPLPPPMDPIHRLGYHAVHTLALTGLVALALTGAVALAASGMPPTPRHVATPVAPSPPQQAHTLLAVSLSGLLIAHVVGVLSYRPRGVVLRRMGIGGPRPVPRVLGHGERGQVDQQP